MPEQFPNQPEMSGNGSISPKRKRKATKKDLINTFLFNGAEDLLDPFADGSSYICTLEMGQKMELTRNGVEHIYIITKGHLRLCIQNPRTTEEIFIAWRNPGQILGEMSPLAGEPKPVIIEASTDCEFVEIPSQLFLEQAEQTHILYRNLVILLIQKTYEERQRSELLQSFKTPSRIIYTLVKLHKERGFVVDANGHHVINGILRQKDVAAFVGLRRQSSGPYFNKLESDGLVECSEPGNNRATIKILNIEGLREKCPKLIHDRDAPVP